METLNSYFGFIPGSDRNMADWTSLTAFYKALAAESDKILCIDRGPTTDGLPYLELIISSPENLAQLEEYRKISMTLSDPRGLTQAQIDALAETGKAVCVQTMSAHAAECGPAQMAPRLVYELVTSDAPDVKQILENVITIIIPSQNPDGLDKIVSRYNKYKGTENDAVDHPGLWHKYAGYTINKDLYFELYKEGQYLSQILLREWMPQVYIDHHHMWRTAPRMFVPPFTDPLNPDCAPLLIREQALLGADMAYDLEQAGVQGVVSNQLFPVEGMDSTQTTVWYHNIIGMLTESASARFASSTYVQPERLPQEPASVFCPNPWKGGWWNFSDITSQQYIASKSLLSSMARNKTRLLRNMAQKAILQTERGLQDPDKAYIIPPVQHDPSAAEKLVTILRRQGIQFQISATPVAAQDCVYPAGSVVIPLNQPKYAMIRFLLRSHPFPKNCFSERDDGSVWVYAVAAQSIAAMMGVRVLLAGCDVSVDTSAQNTAFVRAADCDGILSGRENASFRLVNALLKNAKSIYRDSVTGDFYTQNAPAQATLLRPVALGVYQTPWGIASTGGGVDDEGHIRLLLERFGFPYQSVGPADVRAGVLDELDVLYFPDNLPGDLDGANNSMKEALPEERDWLHPQEEEQLRAFVHRGGRILAVGQSAKYIIRILNLKIDDKSEGHIPPHVNGLRSAGGPASRKDWYLTRRSLLHADVIPSELTLGMDSHSCVLNDNSPIFEITEYFKPFQYETLLRYPKEDILEDGVLLGDHHLAGKPCMVRAHYGEGDVILYGFSPAFRGWTEGTFKTIFNALYKTTN